MKYYLIAGEASGDLHASNLMKAILKEDPQAEFRFWGGDLMQSVGGTLVKHYKELAFMGFVEVLLNLKTILSNIKICKEDILNYQPDAIIFIDYPGFNLRIAKWAKKQEFPTHYYISPQIWAWKESRINQIKKSVDQMYVILPFEKEYYEEKHQYPVHFVGNPLIDAIADRKEVDPISFKEKHNLSNKPIIAVLPGSRKQEISKMLKLMISIVPEYTEYQFVIAGAPSQDKANYLDVIAGKDVSLIFGETYNLLSIAHAAIVTSGTATLETALFKVPEVVCYKGSFISYHIAKRIINLKYISLVNLILDREAVTELIQNNLTSKTLKSELNKLLNIDYRNKLIADYDLLENKLGGQGASSNTAKLIVNSLKSNNIL